jgi:nitroreductase
VGYLLLAAQSLGYATSPMQGFDGDAVKKLLGLPASAEVVALVAMGSGRRERAPAPSPRRGSNCHVPLRDCDRRSRLHP